MKRGFKVVSEYEDKGINLPKRGTDFSAGYDIEAAENIVIPSLFGKYSIAQMHPEDLDDISTYMKPTMVPTGIKCYISDQEALFIYNRSSSSKRGLMLANNVAVIDADYYNNPNNEGHIFLPMWNLGAKDIHIKKGERLAQGVFQQYFLADVDVTGGQRTGGIGSTGL